MLRHLLIVALSTLAFLNFIGVSAPANAQAIAPSAVEAPDERRRLTNGNLYFAQIACSSRGRSLAQVQTRLRAATGKRGLNLQTYLLMFGFTGLYPEGKPAGGPAVEMKDEAGQPLTKVTVEGTTITPVVAPVMARAKGRSNVNVDYLSRVPCGQSLYFRYDDDNPAMAVWAEFGSNKNRAKALQDVLSPAAAVFDEVLGAVFNKTIPGMGQSTEIEAFSKALGELINVFDKEALLSDTHLLQIGRNTFDTAGLSVSVTVHAPDKRSNGDLLGLVDHAFLTGTTPFSSTWDNFLGGGEAGLLRKIARQNVDNMASCQTTRNTLSKEVEAARLSDVDMAFVMLAAMKGGSVSSNNAWACLGSNLACVSRDFTDPQKARRSAGVEGVVTASIEQEHWFDRSLPDIVASICPELDRSRQNSAAAEEILANEEAKKRAAQEKERLASELAEQVSEAAKRKAFIEATETHTSAAWQFFREDSNGKDGPQRFMELANVMASLPPAARAGFLGPLDRLGAGEIEGSIPAFVIGEIYGTSATARATMESDESTAEQKAEAKKKFEALNTYFADGLWQLGATTTTKVSLSFFIQAIESYGIKHMACYRAYTRVDAGDGNLARSPLPAYFGFHSASVRLPHFVVLAFKDKPKTLEELESGHVIHGFVEGDKIVGLALDRNDNVTAASVSQAMKEYGLTNSCVSLMTVTAVNGDI